MPAIHLFVNEGRTAGSVIGFNGVGKRLGDDVSVNYSISFSEISHYRFRADCYAPQAVFSAHRLGRFYPNLGHCFSVISHGGRCSVVVVTDFIKGNVSLIVVGYNLTPFVICMVRVFFSTFISAIGVEEIKSSPKNGFLSYYGGFRAFFCVVSASR